MSQNWMNHPSLASIDAAKLQMLQSLASQGAQKGKGMSFTPDEMNMIIEVMKSGKSPEETAQMDKMLNLLKMMK